MKTPQRLAWFATLLLVAILPVVHQPPRAAAAPPSKVVFVAYNELENQTKDRITAFQNIYTVNPDGSGLTQLTFSSEHRWYDYAVWALGGTKIIYSSRSAYDAQDDEIWSMDADGTHRQPLTHDLVRKGQPKLFPDGKTLIFTGLSPQFRNVAIYALHLETGDVENLTAKRTPTSGVDADPKLAPDGRRIVYVSKGAHSKNGQVYLMNTDGTDGHQVFEDAWLDTDPALAPDNRFVLVSSFTGSGSPLSGDQLSQVKRSGWTIERLDLATGATKALTHDMDCSGMVNPCSPDDGSAYVPQWSPDGSQAAFVAVRGAGLGGIYRVDRDGGNPAVIFESTTLRMSWFDWQAMTGTDAALGTPPASRSVLTFAARTHSADDTGGDFGPAQLFLSGPDRWGAISLTHDGRWYDQPRWSRDRRSVVATVRRRQNDVSDEHLVLIDVTSQRQLTLTSGPERDTDPEFSADGSSIYFTRYAADGSGSAIMRINVDGTGLTNLSAVSAGGRPTADSKPRLSPDGTLLAFVTLAGSFQVAVMNADGTSPILLSEDAGNDNDPAWSPDGTLIAYTTTALDANGNTVPNSTALQVLEPTSGRYWQLLSEQRYLATPVFSPDGGWIMYVVLAPGGEADLFEMHLNGSNAHDVQPTLLTNEQAVDWR